MRPRKFERIEVELTRAVEAAIAAGITYEELRAEVKEYYIDHLREEATRLEALK